MALQKIPLLNVLTDIIRDYLMPSRRVMEHLQRRTRADIGLLGDINPELKKLCVSEISNFINTISSFPTWGWPGSIYYDQMSDPSQVPAWDPAG